MNIENIIRAWKADEDNWQAPLVANPVGQELTEEELLEVGGGVCFLTNCIDTCGIGISCNFTCGSTVCILSTIN